MAPEAKLAALPRDLRAEYDRHVRAAGNHPRFLAGALFLVTFVAIRIVTHAIRGGVGPFFNVDPAGVHVHHMVPGLVLVLVAGILMLSEGLNGCGRSCSASARRSFLTNSPCC